MRKRLRDATTRATELQGKLDALATVTANLYYENLDGNQVVRVVQPLEQDGLLAFH
ncbi:hypothetical protein ABZV34_27345 [Streptomyces sp. NPDC005195]|uniref:hypothetical protein n=1 Tax=Streptomyces sp. NPDC005195 TaxID=3154561 RepID=UPI0033BC03C4